MPTSSSSDAAPTGGAADPRNRLPDASSILRSLFPMSQPESSAAPNSSLNLWRSMIHLSIFCYAIASVLSFLNLFLRVITQYVPDASPQASSSSYASRFATLSFISSVCLIVASTFLYVSLVVLASLASCLNWSSSSSFTSLPKHRLFSRVYARFVAFVIAMELMQLVYRSLVASFDVSVWTTTYWLNLTMSLSLIMICCCPCLFCAQRYHKEVEMAGVGASGGASSVVRGEFPGEGRASGRRETTVDEREVDPVASSNYANSSASGGAHAQNLSDDPEQVEALLSQEQLAVRAASSAHTCIVPRCENYGNETCGGMCNEHFRKAISPSNAQTSENEAVPTPDERMDSQIYGDVE